MLTCHLALSQKNKNKKTFGVRKAAGHLLKFPLGLFFIIAVIIFGGAPHIKNKNDYLNRKLSFFALLVASVRG